MSPEEYRMWLSSIKDSQAYKGIDEFLSNVIGDDKEFRAYKHSLAKKIRSTEGKTEKDKLIHYTALGVKIPKEDWDAWKWPGYY